VCNAAGNLLRDVEEEAREKPSDDEEELQRTDGEDETKWKRFFVVCWIIPRYFVVTHAFIENRSPNAKKRNYNAWRPQFALPVVARQKETAALFCKSILLMFLYFHTMSVAMSHTT